MQVDFSKNLYFFTVSPVLQCADPVGIINGMVTKTGNAIGDTANYICNSGFELIGQATVTCTSINQTFAAFQPPPTCRREYCMTIII